MQSQNPRPPQIRRTTTNTAFRSPVMAAPFIFRTTGSRRPVDKNLVSINHLAVDATQQNTTLVTVTFPCTIVGIRWDISVIQQAGNGHSDYGWCINVLRDGGTQKVMSLTSGSTFFAPESDCLAFGSGTIDDNNQGNVYNGATKTMRKMMGGDKLIFSSKGIATNTSTLVGVIQFFCKT